MLPETLRSILAQTHRPGEVIVVDDGGTDDTEAVVRPFQVRYIRVENGGPGSARNAGVAVAGEDWIAFCDADDLWRPTYLERFISRLTPNSVYGFANWLDVIDGRWTSTDKFSQAPEGFFEDLTKPLYGKLIDFTPIWPSATLIRRDFFHQLQGFNPKLSRLPTEDFEFALRCNEQHPAVVMSEALVGIRKHAGNYSRGRIRQDLSDATILAWARDHHRLGQRYRTEIDASIVRRRLKAFNEAFANGDMHQVREIASTLPSNALSAKEAVKKGLAFSRLAPSRLIAAVSGRKPERI